MQEDRALKPEDVIDHFRKKFRDADLDILFGADSDYDDRRTTWAQFLNVTGLGKAPKVGFCSATVLEGKVHESDVKLVHMAGLQRTVELQVDNLHRFVENCD